MSNIFSCVCYLSVCLLWRNVCLGLFPTFWLGCFFLWYWVVWAACIFWKLILCQLFHLLLLSPIIVSFAAQKLLILIRSCCCCCCRFSRVRLCATPQMTAHQAPCPWDSPGKNTGVGCHFLLQCMKVKSGSEVSRIRLLVTPWTAAYQPPPFMGFSRQEYWSGVPLPSPTILTTFCLFIHLWTFKLLSPLGYCE